MDYCAIRPDYLTGQSHLPWLLGVCEMDNLDELDCATERLLKLNEEISEVAEKLDSAPSAEQATLLHAQLSELSAERDSIEADLGEEVTGLRGYLGGPC
jgi:hypothetical protein